MRAQANKPTGTTVYEDFSLGEYGVQHPRQGKAGQFHGMNVVVYRDGTLGPRNGLIAQPLSGANYINGPLNMLYYGVEHELSTPRMVFGQDETPAYFEVNTITAQNPGRFTGVGGTPDPFVFASPPDGGYVAVLPRLGFNMYWSPLGDNTYLVDALSDEVTTLTGTNQSFGAHDIVEHLDQLYLIGIGDGASGRGHKIVYSDNADPETWPDENIFLVGYAWVVFRGVKMMNGLLVITQDQSWWLLQGDPIDGSLRRVASGRSSDITNPTAIQVSRERAWFLADAAPGGAYPCVFDGSELDTTSHKHLRDWLAPNNENLGGLVCEADEDLLWIDEDGKAIMRHEGVWTRHEFGADVGHWCAAYEDQRFYLAKDGTDSTKPVFYRSTFDTGDGPAIYDADGFTSPGDGDLVPVDAWVEFPEVWQEDGSTAKPIGVTLEFTTYDTGGSLDPHITCEVDVINRFGFESTETIACGEWDESDADVASTEDGVRRKHIFRPPVAHQGAALQLRFTDIRGLKIERAVFDYELGSQLDRA